MKKSKKKLEISQGFRKKLQEFEILFMPYTNLNFIFCILRIRKESVPDFKRILKTKFIRNLHPEGNIQKLQSDGKIVNEK